jgi:hypothetical protein
VLHCIPPGILSFSSGFIIAGSGVHTVTGTRSGLTATIATTRSSARIFTMSLIIKRVQFGVREGFFYQQANGNGENAGLFEFDGSDRLSLKIQQVDSGNIKLQRITTQVFRDPSAWMHIHIAVNTGLTTDACCKIHINGTEITAFGTKTNIDSARDHGFLNSSKEVVLMGSTDTISGSATEFQQFAYMARVFVQDGVYGAPTDVGEVTEDGFWQINDASELTFGNNGFLLEGGANISDGIDTLATGKDDVRDIGDSVTKWKGTTGSFSYAQGDGNEISATTADDSIYSSHVFKGDFDFNIVQYDATNGLLGVFASNEVATFAGANTDGNLDAMTNSFWIHRATGGAANLAYVGGDSEGVTLSHTNGANYRFERRSGTITLYKNGASLREFSSTYTGNMVAFIGNGNTNFEAVDVTITDKAGGNNFAATGTITATNDSPTNGDA